MKRLIIYLMIALGVSGCHAAAVNRAATLRQLLAVSNTVEAVEASVATNALALTGHTSDTDNPHKVTLEQLGGLPDETDPIFTAWDKTTGISIKENQITDLKPYATESYVTNAIANIPAVVIPEETDPRAMRLYHYGDPDIQITPAGAFGFDPLTGTITGYAGTDEDIVLPYEIGGIPVVAIGTEVFNENQVVKTLIAPKTLTSIGDSAFLESSLTTLTAPALTTIGSGAFSDSSLTTLTAPALTTIGGGAFTSSSLTSLVAPALTSIGSYAFTSSSLTSLVAPALTTVDSYAFANSPLTSLVAPALTSIGDYAFANSPLTSLVAPELTTIGSFAFRGSSLTAIYYGGNKPTAGRR